MLLGYHNQTFKPLGVPSGHIRQGLAIKFYLGDLQAVNELAIGEAQLPGPSADPQNPEAAEVAFPLPAMAIRVAPRVD